MNTTVLDHRCIQAVRSGTPHGYVLPNGVVVVWASLNSQHNLASYSHAIQMFPTLTLVADYRR